MAQITEIKFTFLKLAVIWPLPLSYGHIIDKSGRNAIFWNSPWSSIGKNT